MIQGVSESAPTPGEIWEGADLQAGIAIWVTIGREAYVDQITSVRVKNFGGRVNPRATHIELTSDLSGGRIRWGSAPGFELEENTVAEKLAILRANFLQTGRADAGNRVIDISTYVDRYTISG